MGIKNMITGGSSSGWSVKDLKDDREQINNLMARFAIRKQEAITARVESMSSLQQEISELKDL